MTSTESYRCPLLLLPPEVRNLIYRYAFQLSRPLRLRSPSRRRLQPSRLRSDDPRGFLDTCRLVRSEAITLYYGLNPLLFRSTEHALQFVNDRSIDPAIAQAISHIAVDVGDTVDADSILTDHVNLVDTCVGSLPCLRALETRFYALNPESSCSFHFWKLAVAIDDLYTDESPESPLLERYKIPYRSQKQYCFADATVSRFCNEGFTCVGSASSEWYPGGNNQMLWCYNLMIALSDVPNVLGRAKEAVQERLETVGVLPSRATETYDITMDGRFHRRVLASIETGNRTQGVTGE